MSELSTKITIILMSGPEDGKEIELEKSSVTFGRLDDNDVHIPYDITVSRHHARITREEDEYFIEDMGSTNGTYLQGEKIKGRVKISSGDLFLIGNTWLKFLKS